MQYVNGDLFSLIKDKTGIVVPHVCNTKGVFGSGFAKVVGKLYPETFKKYARYCEARRLAEPKYYAPFTAFTPEKFGYFSNMICQTSFGQGKNAKYIDLIKCMNTTKTFCLDKGSVIYAPKFGAGLCGLSWEFISHLIEEIWVDGGLSVTIVELTND